MREGRHASVLSMLLGFREAAGNLEHKALSEEKTGAEGDIIWASLPNKRKRGGMVGFVYIYKARREE